MRRVLYRALIMLILFYVLIMVLNYADELFFRNEKLVTYNAAIEKANNSADKTYIREFGVSTETAFYLADRAFYETLYAGLGISFEDELTKAGYPGRYVYAVKNVVKKGENEVD